VVMIVVVIMRGLCRNPGLSADSVMLCLKARLALCLLGNKVHHLAAIVEATGEAHVVRTVLSFAV